MMMHADSPRVTGSARAEIILDPQRVEAVAHGLFATDCVARVQPQAGQRTTQQLARAVRFDPAAELSMLWQVERPWPEPPFEIHTFGYNSGFVFPIERAEEHDGLLAVELPASIIRSRGQKHRRVTAPVGTDIILQRPGSNTMVVRPVYDLSFEGLSFFPCNLEEGLYLGLEIPEVRIELPGGIEICGRATVIHVASGLPDGRVITGLRFAPSSPVENQRWMLALSRLLYPSTQLGGDCDAALWQLYVRAGYFDMNGKSADEFDARRDAFAVAHRRIAQAPSLACQVVWPGAGHLEASVTMIKSHTHTWVGYQLARRRDTTPRIAGRQILREVLLHGYEYPQHDEDFRWLVTWVRVDGRFGRLLMYDFTQRYTDNTDRADIIRFHAMWGCTDDIDRRLPDAVDISPPDPRERSRLLWAIARDRSRAYVEAHDLIADRFDLASIENQWRQAGMTRDRHVLVARRDGRLVAGAVLELVDDGLHLYGLLDVARLFDIDDASDADRTALLRAAADWYRQRGKAGFAYFCETPDMHHALAAKLEDIGEADMTVLSADLMPDQLEHAWEITAPKQLRRIP